MIELNPEQRQAAAHGEPVCIIDPSTHDTYILVRAEVYARLAAVGPDHQIVRDQVNRYKFSDFWGNIAEAIPKIPLKEPDR